MAGTQNITVLFTDLVGSTELTSTLTPDAAEEVRRAHFSALREAIAATGGVEVKNLGDGFMVAFDAITSALSCATAMQQAIERHNRKFPVPLAVRIGISTGDVTVDDGDYFGDPVVEAARLCAVAQGGQILATEALKIVARRSGHSFATERELELKGLPGPVVAWEVVWEPAQEETDTSGVPLPPRLPPDPGIGVVGRRVELERLKEALKAVTSGEPARMVLVAGEAGVGKSTLTSSLARDAHNEGAVVLYGRCDEDLAVPHQPFVEALGHYVAHAQDTVFSELGDDHLSALLRLVPELQKRRPELATTTSSDPEAERWILYGAVLALLEHGSRDALVVMILDDLHWADRPTLQLLRQVASHRPGCLLVLGTYRETDLSASHPLTETLAALTREPSVSRVSLSGLEDNEVVSFVEAAAGQILDEAGVRLAHALYQETDGNPFFMAEVLRHLVETRSIIQDENGRWVPIQELADAGLPDSVRQVIGSRVSRLGEDATRVLSAASVLGQEFEVELVASVTEMGVDPVLDLLEAAVSSALIGEVRLNPGHFRFAHALVQHTLYEDLSVTRRSRLHRACAESLEKLLGGDPGARAGELARHWLAATKPIESTKAIKYARIAGDNALASLAPAEAIRWYNEAIGALTHGPDERERARCLAGLGEAQRQLGNRAYRETLLEAADVAQRIGDIHTLVRAALTNNRGLQSTIGQVDAERIATLEMAIEALGTTDLGSRARLLALLALERTYDGDYRGRKALADEALELARRINDPVTVLDVMLRRFQAVWMPEAVEEQLAVSLEAESLSEQLGDPVAKFWAVDFHGVFSIMKGDASEIPRLHDELARLASEVGQPMLKWTSAFNRSWSTLLGGDVARAEILAEEALQIGIESGEPDIMAFYGGQLFALRWHEGRMDEIVEIIAQVAVDNPGLPAYRAAAAHALIELNRDDEAREMLEAEKSSGFSAPNDYVLPTYLDVWARVVSHLNDREAAETLYRRLPPPDLIVSNGLTVQGSAAYDFGILTRVLGRYDEAEAYFAKALKVHKNLEAPFFIALTQLEWGRMLLARRAPGDLARAEQMLHSALDLAQKYGFAAVERRAGEALSLT